ncbi:peptidoglycan DD-metalloendopeptidase family protein [Leptospira sp. WS92.C1]
MGRAFFPASILFIFFSITTRIFAANTQNFSFYTVQKGDTYYSLGKKFNIGYQKIMELNGKKNKDPLIPGESLKILKSEIRENGRSNLQSPKTNPKFNIVESDSQPNLRFPLKSRPPLQSPYSKLSFAPNKGVLFKATRHNEVKAATSGKVLVVDEMDGYKKYVILEHKNGYSTVYANLKSVSVAEGEIVDSSKVLGALESGKGLYFQLNHGGSAINPGLQLR